MPPRTTCAKPTTSPSGAPAPSWAGRVRHSAIAGAGVPIGALSLDPKSKRTVIVPFSGLLGAGAYKVSWSMKTVDGHTTSGDFGFKVK